MSKQQNILIIGMSKMGKTHFGGQLYGRLKTATCTHKLAATPRDLSLFEDILSRLNQGYEGKHTDAKLHQTVSLPVVSPAGKQLEVVYPDYGGEQLRGLVEGRQISKTWQEEIQSSEHWFLFIRLDLIENMADVTTKFYRQIEEEQEVPAGAIKNIKELPDNSSAFYVELLQTFLSVKGLSPPSLQKPSVTVLLSCWDKLDNKKTLLPEQALKEQMPLLFSFLESNWHQSNLQILGLSSLGKDLNSKQADVDFATRGPEHFGYLIASDGNQDDDLTNVLNIVNR